MTRRLITAIRNPRTWDGAARPISEAEALRLAAQTARDIAEAGFSITMVVDETAERDDQPSARTIH